jgi:predicted DNA-binding protein
MGKHQGSKAYGLRLPNEVWDRIDAAAAALGMSRNEYLARCITTAVSRGREHRKTVEIGHGSASTITLREEH